MRRLGNRQRGFALVIALASIMVVFGAVIFLGNASAGRVRAKDAEHQREQALRQAESALEMARVRTPAIPGTFTFEGATVALSTIKGGIRAEAFVLFPEARAGTKRGTPRVKRGVRVSWDLIEGRWTAWRARTETVAP